MTMDGKKLAAVSAAVFTYIKTQEEAAFMAVAAGSVPETASEPTLQQDSGYRPNIWGMAGRDAHMSMRSLMNMRAFK